MSMRPNRAFAIVALAINLLAASAWAEEKKPTKPAGDSKEQKEEQRAPELTKSIEMMHALRAAEILVNYGRKEKDPIALLTAARIIGSSPKVKSEQFGKAVPKEKVEEAPDPAKAAAALVEEALKLAAEGPDDQVDSVKTIAASVSKHIGETSRVPVGGQRRFDNFFFNGGQQDTVTVDLIGVSTGIYLASNGPHFSVKVTGAITGWDYGTYQAFPGVPFSGAIGHLPTAKLNFTVINNSPFAGTGTLHLY